VTDPEGAGLRVGMAVVESRWRRSGLGIYATELARALGELERGPELALYSDERSPDPPWAGCTTQVTSIGPWAQRLLRRGIGRVERYLPAMDLIHFTDVQTSPTRKPSVVTIHDLTPFRLPALFPEVYTDSYNPALSMYRSAIRLAVRRADLLVCVSGATHADLVDLFPESEPRAVVVRSGVRRPPAGFARKLEDGPVRLVVVGRVEHRKNLPTAVEAVRALRDRGMDVELHVVGSVDGTEADVIRRGCGAAAASEWLVWHGAVSDDVLWGLLESSHALLSPSLYEGFSFPPLEAATAGVAVIASDIAAHREMLDGIATLVPPDDPAAWIDAICATVRGAGSTAPPSHDLLAARGIDWAHCAAATARAYVRVLESR
jgi:glycosyltransferase involved in cell wall biosynthesis